MVALAHVVAPRALGIGEVAEVDRVFGGDGLARRRRLLQRHTVLMAPGDIHEGAAIGTQHPLVGREDQEVGVERLHIDAADADIVCRIDQQRGASRLGGGCDPRHVERAAIGPMHGGDRHQCKWRSTGELDRFEHGGGPIPVGRLLHRFDGEARRVGATHPFQDRRSVVVLQHQHAAAAGDRHHLAGRRHAVPHRRDQGDVGRIGADQRGRGLAGSFVLVALEGTRELPGLAFVTDGSASRFLHRDGQRAPRRGIHETDVAWNVEQGALTRKHAGLQHLAQHRLARLSHYLPCN